MVLLELSSKVREQQRKDSTTRINKKEGELGISRTPEKHVDTNTASFCVIADGTSRVITDVVSGVIME